MSVYFITGASSGIGQALALKWGTQGHSVALVARRKDRIEATAEEIRAKGGQAIALPCDVSQKEEVAEAVQKARKALGPITHLIANAGIGKPSPGHRFNANIFEEIMKVNYFGAVYCLDAILPEMIERKQGHLVAISSLASKLGLPGSGAYSASKAALTLLFDSLRIDLYAYHIDVTVIHPGFIQTPMTHRNDFPMPLIMPLDKAVHKIDKAIQKRVTTLNFPWAMDKAIGMARTLPPKWMAQWLSKKRF